MTTLTPYSDQDLPAVFALWQTVFADTWSLTEPLLRAVLANPVPDQSGTHFVARYANRVVGFAATQLTPNRNAPPTGFVLALLVDPGERRKRIGTALLDAAIESLRAGGAQRIVIGGKYPRIWPGIPETHLDALEFFGARGWTAAARKDQDLIRDLSDYESSPTVYTRLAAEGVTIAPGTAANAADVVTFNQREFAGWSDTYRFVASVGDVADFLVARDPAKGIIGSLIMFGPHSNPSRIDALWKPRFGATLGGLGEVGVAQSERGRGIGLALVAVGSEVLKARGVGMCNIGFTSLAEFYGKLGYKPWQTYHIVGRNFT